MRDQASSSIDIHSDLAPPIFRFCFESATWKELFGTESMVLLDRVYRQDDDNFLRILSEVRRGEISGESCHILEAKVRTLTVVEFCSINFCG